MRPTSKERNSHEKIFFKHFLILVCTLAMLMLPGLLLLTKTSISQVMAISLIPAKPASLSGMPGDQQVFLHWAAVAGASAYSIEQTDLDTGQTKRLADSLVTPSFSPTGLLVGHWYRFRVIPISGMTEGTPSDPIDIRTKGFSGSYDHYYALGDSYSSGLGAPPFSGLLQCARSLQSYPYLLGNGVPTPVPVACAGATTNNVDQSIQFPWLPGTQLDELRANPHTNTLITITIGGNDVDFASALKSCLVSFPSCASQSNMVAQRIVNLQLRLAQVYREIRQVAPGADIIVLGYPWLLAAPELARCHNPVLGFSLNATKMRMIRMLGMQLDNVISQAAAQSGITAATQEVENVFAGHEACAPAANGEWINEITGSNVSLMDSFHPNSIGYQALAEALNASRTALYQNGMVRYP